MGSMLASLMLLAAAPSAAAPPRWSINQGAEYCSLIRHAEAGDFKTLLVRQAPGRGVVLWLIDGQIPDKLIQKSDGATVTLGPDGGSFSSSGRVRRLDGGRALQLFDVPSDFLDQLTRANSIKIVRGRKLLYEARTPLSGKAISSLGACERRMLQAWGIDPARYFALRSRPKPKRNPSALISDSDYPAAALSDGRGGSLTVRLDIDEQGRITDCVPVHNDGHPALGPKTCQLMQERAQFEPARDAAGAPTKGWQLITFSYLAMAGP